MVACWSRFLGVVGEGGSGGRSRFAVRDEAFVETEVSLLEKPEVPEPELEEPSDRCVPLFSQVKGGPDTGMGLGLTLPIVPVWRTVPKSHRSSGSESALKGYHEEEFGGIVE